jgi:endogenous inhibitor of DNA gyrase (YacG/DUF329 family)
MASASGSAKCPICGRPSVQEYRPFCSRRCADVDLARWLSGTYVIPDGEETEDGTPSSTPADGEDGDAEADPSPPRSR